MQGKVELQCKFNNLKFFRDISDRDIKRANRQIQQHFIFRKSKYQPDWEKQYKWLTSDLQNKSNARCIICGVNFTIGSAVSNSSLFIVMSFSYLTEWFDFSEDNWLSTLPNVSLKNEVIFLNDLFFRLILKEGSVLSDLLLRVGIRDAVAYQSEKIKCSKCRECNNEPVVYCDSCERAVHTECSELSASELKVMSLKNKGTLKYFCEDCLAGVRAVPTLIKKIDEFQTQIEDLNLRLTSPTPEQHSTFTKVDEEDIIMEMQEQRAIKNNIMIFNLPETREPDNTVAKNIFRELTSQDMQIIATNRIGKKNKNDHQALKVVLSNPQDVKKILLSRKEILKPRKTFVTQDMTPKQRQNINKLKSEIDSRREQGEHNLALKYIRGIPKIVQTTERASRKN
nr:unnamed protein product [Callosobruchus analis]